VLTLEPAATSWIANLASGHHRELCVKRRMQKTSNTKEPVKQDYLYTDHEQGALLGRERRLALLHPSQGCENKQELDLRGEG